MIASLILIGLQVWRYSARERNWKPKVLAEVLKRNPKHTVQELDNGELHVWRLIADERDRATLETLVRQDRKSRNLGESDWDQMRRYASTDGAWFVYLSDQAGQGVYDGVKPGKGRVLCVVTHYLPRPWFRQLF